MVGDFFSWDLIEKGRWLEKAGLRMLCAGVSTNYPKSTCCIRVSQRPEKAILWVNTSPVVSGRTMRLVCLPVCQLKCLQFHNEQMSRGCLPPESRVPAGGKPMRGVRHVMWRLTGVNHLQSKGLPEVRLGKMVHWDHSFGNLWSCYTSDQVTLWFCDGRNRLSFIKEYILPWFFMFYLDVHQGMTVSRLWK